MLDGFSRPNVTFRAFSKDFDMMQHRVRFAKNLKKKYHPNILKIYDIFICKTCNNS